jgi:TfoX/Sxy family transcriptional regulator of competence genes
VTDELADLVRVILTHTKRVREVKMFGGIGFMLNDRLLVAASPRGLLVRVGKEAFDKALARPGAAPMIMRGRAMEGYVRIARERLDKLDVESWVQLAMAFLNTLPPKAADFKGKSPTRAGKKTPKSSVCRG